MGYHKRYRIRYFLSRVANYGLLYTEQNYKEAFKEAKNIISWCNIGKCEERDVASFKAAFRILFEIHQKKKEPEKIIYFF